MRSSRSSGDNISFEASSTSGDSGAKKKEKASTEEAIFGVLFALTQHSGQVNTYLPYIGFFIDFFSFVGFNFGKVYPWSSTVHAVIGKAVSAVQVRLSGLLISYAPRLGVWGTVLGILLLSYSVVLYIAWNFRINKFKYIWPIKFLRSWVAVMPTMFFVAFLNVLLMPLGCTGTFGEATLDEFPDIYCWDFSTNGVVAILSILAILSFMCFSFTTVFVYYESNPTSVNPTAAPHSRFEVTLLLSRASLTLATNVLSRHIQFTAILTLLLSALCFFSLLYHSPYFARRVTVLRSGLFCMAFWTSICLNAVVAVNDRTDDTWSFLLLTGLPFALAAGCSAAHFRLKRADGRRSIIPTTLLSQSGGSSATLGLNSAAPGGGGGGGGGGSFIAAGNSSNNNSVSNFSLLSGGDTFGVLRAARKAQNELAAFVSDRNTPTNKKKGKKGNTKKKRLRSSEAQNSALVNGMIVNRKFWTDTEVELSTRFVCLDMDSEEKERAVLEAKALFLEGLRQHPKSPFLHLAFANFCRYELLDQRLSDKHVNTAETLKPNFGLRFLIYTRKKESASGRADVVGQGDLITEIDFKRNYDLARKYHSEAVFAIKNLWRTLLIPNVQVSALPGIMSKIHLKDAAAADCFKQLLSKHRSNPRVLRSYGMFLADVKGDLQRAQSYFDEAEDLEERKGKEATEGWDATIGLNAKFDNQQNQLLQHENVGFGFMTEPGFPAMAGDPSGRDGGPGTTRALLPSGCITIDSQGQVVMEDPMSRDLLDPVRPLMWSPRGEPSGHMAMNFRSVLTPNSARLLDWAISCLQSDHNDPSVSFSLYLFAFDQDLTSTNPSPSTRRVRKFQANVYMVPYGWAPPPPPPTPCYLSAINSPRLSQDEEGETDDCPNDSGGHNWGESKSNHSVSWNSVLSTTVVDSNAASVYFQIELSEAITSRLGWVSCLHTKQSPPPEIDLDNFEGELNGGQGQGQAGSLIVSSCDDGVLSVLGREKWFVCGRDLPTVFPSLSDIVQNQNAEDGTTTHEEVFFHSPDYWLSALTIPQIQTTNSTPKNATTTTQSSCVYEISICLKPLAPLNSGGSAVPEKEGNKTGRGSVPHALPLKPSAATSGVGGGGGNVSGGNFGDASSDGSSSMDRRGKSKRGLRAAQALGQKKARAVTLMHRRILVSLVCVGALLIASYFVTDTMLKGVQTTMQTLFKAGQITATAQALVYDAKSISIAVGSRNLNAIPSVQSHSLKSCSNFETLFQDMFLEAQKSNSDSLLDFYYRSQIVACPSGKTYPPDTPLASIPPECKLPMWSLGRTALLYSRILNTLPPDDPKMLVVDGMRPFKWLDAFGPTSVFNACEQLEVLYQGHAKDTTFLAQWVQGCVEGLNIVALAVLVFAIIQPSFARMGRDRHRTMELFTTIPKTFVLQLLKKKYYILDTLDESASDSDEYPEEHSEGQHHGRRSSIVFEDALSTTASQATTATSESPILTSQKPKEEKPIFDTENENRPKGKDKSVYKDTMQNNSEKGKKEAEEKGGKSLDSPVVRKLELRYMFVIFCIVALISVSIVLANLAATTSKGIADDLKMANSRQNEFERMRTYVRRLALDQHNDVWAAEVSKASVSVRKLHTRLAYSGRVSLQANAASTSSQRSTTMTAIGGSTRTPQENLLLSPGCFLEDQSLCPSPSDPDFVVLTRGLGSLVSYYVDKADSFVLNSAKSNYTLNETSFQFLAERSYPMMHGGLALSSELYYADAVSILQESSMAQLGLLLAMIGLVLVLYFANLAPIVDFMREESERTIAMLAMLPGDVIYGVPQIRDFFEGKHEP